MLRETVKTLRIHFRRLLAGRVARFIFSFSNNPWGTYAVRVVSDDTKKQNHYTYFKNSRLYFLFPACIYVYRERFSFSTFISPSTLDHNVRIPSLTKYEISCLYPRDDFRSVSKT